MNANAPLLQHPKPLELKRKPSSSQEEPTS